MTLPTNEEVTEALDAWGENGNEKWKDILIRSQPHMMNVAMAMTHDKYIAEDAVADVTAKLLERKPNYNPAHSFSTYIGTAVHNRILDMRRSQKRHPYKSLSDTEIEDTKSSRNAVDDLDEKNFYLNKLERLLDDTAREPKVVQAFRMTAMEGKPDKEVAASLGIKEKTVRSARSNIRNELKFKAEEQGWKNMDDPSDSKPRGR